MGADTGVCGDNRVLWVVYQVFMHWASEGRPGAMLGLWPGVCTLISGWMSAWLSGVECWGAMMRLSGDSILPYGERISRVVTGG